MHPIFILKYITRNNKYIRHIALHHVMFNLFRIGLLNQYNDLYSLREIDQDRSCT